MCAYTRIPRRRSEIVGISNDSWLSSGTGPVDRDKGQHSMKQRSLAILIAISALFCPAALSAAAGAAHSGGWFKSYANLGWCAQERGMDAPVYLDPCSTSSSGLWRTMGSPQWDGETIENVHSRRCLTLELSGTVDLAPCGGLGPNVGLFLENPQPSQRWYARFATASCTHGGLTLENYYGGYLWQSKKSLQIRSTADPTSSHDCWNFFTPSKHRRPLGSQARIGFPAVK
jgi:hypothetical protein